MSLRVRSSLSLALALAAVMPALAQEAQRGGEPAVQRTVVEDDGMRVEELRVRGQTQRIVVHIKGGGANSYEILPIAPGRDLSQDRRATGQRVWSVLSF